MKNLARTIMAIVIAGLIITTVSSCKKETNFDITFKMKTRSSTPALKTLNNLEWNSGSVIIREIVFDGEMTNGESISITHEQISTIDLVTGEANPEILVTIPMGEYKSIELEVEIQDEDDLPSVIAEGTYTNADNVVTPVRFEFNSGEDFKVEADNTYLFDKGTSPIAEIDFSPAVWFSTITADMLNNAERINGVILINELHNTDIFDIVADKLDDATDVEFED